jgi:hypothetical protein
MTISVLGISFDADNADRLVSLGARQIHSLAENNNRWIRFLDPEGNEFDLVASG